MRRYYEKLKHGKITKDFIKEKLLKKYCSISWKKQLWRDLVVTPIRDNYAGLVMAMFHVKGTPPKGYAIYHEEDGLINFYDRSYSTKAFYQLLDIRESAFEDTLKELIWKK